MADKDLLIEREGNLEIITLNRPEKMNALTIDMSNRLTAAIEDAGRDAKVGALIIAGVGDRAFCSGADAGAMVVEGEGLSTNLEEMRRGPVKRATILYNFPKPTFAAINGVAAGGGLGLAVKCDFRIASDKARFVSSFVSRGVVNDGGSSWLLVHILGEAKALELALTGDIINAQEALRIGLVNRVVPHEKLMEVTKEMAGRIAKGPPIAQALIKREAHRAALSVESLEMHLEFEQYCQSQASPQEREEGFRAFLERREPRYPGR